LSNKLYPAVCLMNFISAVFSLLIPLRLSVQTSQPYKSHGITKILYTFKLDCLLTEFGSKILFRVQNICKKILIFKVMSYSYEIPNMWMNLLVPIQFCLLQFYFWLDPVL
jgi:hypothetical protein